MSTPLLGLYQEDIRDTNSDIYRGKPFYHHIGIRAVLILLILGMTGFLPGASPESKGEYYRYRDELGYTHFLDDYGQIPSEFRSYTLVYPEAYDHPSSAGKYNPCDDEERYAAHYLRGADNRLTGSAFSPGNSLETPVIIHENLILVPVLLANKGEYLEVRMLLDTGAATSVIYHDAARRLNLQGGRHREARLVDGQAIAVQDATIPTMRMGPFLLENVTAALIHHIGRDIPYQGLLGMNVLRELSYTIDFNGPTIRWHPAESAENLHARCTHP